MSEPRAQAGRDPIREAQVELQRAIWSCIVDASSMGVVLGGKELNGAIRAFRAAIEAEALPTPEQLARAIHRGKRHNALACERMEDLAEAVVVAAALRDEP